MAKTNKKPKIKTDMQFGNEVHPFESMDELPELKAVGYMHLNGRNWVSYTVTFKGNEVTDIEVGAPTIRGIVDEEAKMNFVRLFSDKE